MNTGDTWTLLDWTGSLLANGFSTSTNLILPDLSSFADLPGAGTSG